jgi:hypothetical protein
LTHFGTNFPRAESEISILHAALSVAGGAAWFLATYAGPIVSLLRSPFSRRTNIVLGVAYLVSLIMLSWVKILKRQEWKRPAPVRRPG